ncbi:MAG: tRNA-guanine transglycosylase, partial [Pirellulaceae bacterium]|nr:tRNA-guanine transglycosylase [Pirellulaceae bacterium]
MSTSFSFAVKTTSGRARRSRLETSRGAVELPTFMPVGTLGSVKGVTPEQLQETGSTIMLANTYHLALRPGEEVVNRLGGLHQFSGWNGPILTDSGGFQLFSLAQLIKVNDKGATFRSHIDGQKFELSPERALEIQRVLGSDIAMVLDHLVALPSEPEVIRDALERTILWARRSRETTSQNGQVQFAIIQGGLDKNLRIECTERLAELDFPGYAIGGLSVG